MNKNLQYLINDAEALAWIVSCLSDELTCDSAFYDTELQQAELQVEVAYSAEYAARLVLDHMQHLLDQNDVRIADLGGTLVVLDEVLSIGEPIKTRIEAENSRAKSSPSPS